MGVSGSGKTTIGKLVADKIGLPFYDADDYHSEKNILKMKNGKSLDDEDRLPWLQKLSGLVNSWQKQGGAILACSALKELYRVLLSKEVSEVKWVYLTGTKDIIADRLKKRKDHFFDVKLLDSQFEALEEPNYGLHIDISQTQNEMVNQLIKAFK